MIRSSSVAPGFRPPPMTIPLAARTLAVGFVAAILAATPGIADGKPSNIVLILADDLGYGDLSSYGATAFETANIDRLAKEGRLFTDAHSPHPVCTPTRYSLMTGRYSWRTWAGTANVWSDDPLLIENGRYTLPMLLGEAGYTTGIVGQVASGLWPPGRSELERRRY